MFKNCFKYIAITAALWLNLGFLPGTISNVQAQVMLNEEAYNGSFVVAEGDDSLSQTQNLVYKSVGRARLILASVCILLAMTGAVQLAISPDKEEAQERSKRIILYSVIGLALIALASDLAQIFDLSGGGLLGGADVLRQRLQIFDNTVRIIITFTKYLIGAVAILMLVVNGLEMISKGGENEDEAKQARNNVIYVLGGLFALIFVDGIIRNVFYKIDQPGSDLTIDLGQGIQELVGFTNLIVSVVGPIAIITLVAGGALYVASFGNEDNQGTAKKMMISSLVGIIVIYGAFGIVSTFISGSL